jgi:hypothetical protein
VVKTKCPILYQARKAANLRRSDGAFSFPVFKKWPTLPQETQDLVKGFYLLDENSRVLTGTKDTRIITENGEKVVVAKRLMSMTLQELFKEFVNAHPAVRIGMTSFAKLRPEQCYWHGYRGFHVQCTCAIHENFKLLLEPLFGPRPSVRDIIPRFVCDVNNVDCMFSVCPTCPTAALDVLVTDVDLEAEVKINEWRSTDRADLIPRKVSGAAYIAEIRRYLPKILVHQYIMRKQQEFFREMKNGLRNNPDHLVLTMDFSQNYTCVIQNATQSYRWSNIQATLHAFYATWYDPVTGSNLNKGFGIVSDNLTHDSNAVAAYISRVIPELMKLRRFKYIHYISDGCAGRYQGAHEMT